MSRTRRWFTTEYKADAAHRVIDSGCTIAEIACELGVSEGLLGRWVAVERRRVDAAHRVIDSGCTIAEIACELGVSEGLLGRWVAVERRRVDAAAARNDEPLTTAERTELARLRKQVVEQEKDIAFLKKAWVFFAG
jgi:transposase-like protein